MNSSALAVIDVGSNAIKYALALRSDMAVVKFERFETFHKGLDNNYNISEPYLDEIIKIILYMKSQIQSFCELHQWTYDIICVGTQVFRSAQNKQDFLQKIYHKCGIKLSVLSNEVEANFEKLGVQNDPAILPFEHSSILLVDFGGGSTEFSWLFSTRPPLCIAVGKQDFMKQLSLEMFYDKYKLLYDALYASLPKIFVLAGSTACCYAQCLQKMKSVNSIQNINLYYDENYIHYVSQNERSTADIGAALVRFLQSFHPEQMRFTTYGLRHGLIYAWANNLPEWMLIE